MGLLTLVEDRPTPKAVYNWRVYTAASVASWAACMIGYDSAFIGTTLALPSFAEEFKFAEMSKAHLNLTKANIVSVYQAGAFFGAFGAYASSHYIGRRKSLILWTLIFIIGAGMMLGANGDRGLGLIIGGRVLAGLGVGGCSNMVPIYISELSPPAVRGRLVGIYELGWQVGGLVGFWINYGLEQTMAPSHKQWIIPFAVQLIPAGCLLIGAVWMRESPRWCLSKGRREQALKDLCWIRNLPEDHPYIMEELEAIDAQVEHDRITVGPGFWKPFAALKQRKVQYRLFLGGMLFLWQNGSGINAINYYSPTVFKSLGVTEGFLTTGIFGVVKTVLTIFWLLYLIDRLGRTKLLMLGALGGSLCMWYIAAYIKIADPANNPSRDGKLTSGGISAVFFFYLWTAFYTPSWNGTPWVINSEMYSQQTRSLGQACAAANNWFWNFIISRFTPQMFSTMGYGVYMFFACLMLLSIPFVFFLIPETKGIPLERMDELFDMRPTYRAHPLLLERLKENEDVNVVIRDEKAKGEHNEMA
ncbi:quinate permease [Pyrenophora tritici-repentis]|nr:Quinate permease [Pyrenophora tritici-repentis]KAF7442247.1 Quinate permease [Pyrenophora tritici-repentis]KAF7579381.1 AraJ, Arabinose efflux permease [Pyrenophora tritici-repentis]KAG9378300.1 Quinate permease [Pyrenophora tritici-repentis]KAI0576075.1 Quinate permease [Pyrenophora tritici-repentis]